MKNEYDFLEYIGKKQEEYDRPQRLPYREKKKQEVELYELLRKER